jgi:branched-chain amino acid transport system ATP-binding protein
MLDIEGVGARFGGVQALEGASFSVRANTITGLIGPNGAGKTTLFDCVSGLLNRYTGHITFDGRAISRLRPESISRRGLLRSFQLARGCPRLTVFEHLMLYGPRQSGESAVRALISRKAIRRQEEALRARVIAVAQRLRLNRVLDNLVTDLSGGQKKLLEIGRVLLGAPRMILLDEPMAGVNPSLVGEIAEHLSVIRDEGITILLIEHEMELIERLCDDVVVMAEGKFLTQGTFHEVTDDRRVQESYLGLRRQ